MKGMTFARTLAAVLGTILIVLGVLALVMIPRFVDREVAKRTYLGFDSNGSYNEMTRKWIEPQYAMAMKIWIFSLTNEADVVKNGSKPRFIEKGPYTFVQHELKNKVVFMYNDTRVLYRTNQKYFFNESLSCDSCRLSDSVTIPNPVFQFIVDFANSHGALIKEAIEVILSGVKRETPFITTTAGQMLYEGFEDPMIASICSSSLLKSICDAAKIPPKIGFFYGQNDTDDGEYLIDTGLTDAQDLGKVYEYNGEFRLPETYWYSPQARMINGTNELFPPALSSSRRLYMFLGQMKRSIYLRYKKKSKVEGVPAWQYVIPPEMYDPDQPEHRGFCNPKTPRFFDIKTQPEGCLPRGFLDLSSTLPSSPRIYLSGSHFLNSPPAVYEVFEGMQKPSAASDESQYDIEPTTGVIVRVKYRSQINVGMVAGNLRILKNMRDMVVPVLWFNETVLFDNETRSELLDNLVLVQTAAYTAGIALLSFGSILWIVFIGLTIFMGCRAKRSEERERLIAVDESDDVPYASTEPFPTIEPLPPISPLSTHPPLLTPNPPVLITNPPIAENQSLYVDRP